MKRAACIAFLLLLCGLLPSAAKKGGPYDFTKPQRVHSEASSFKLGVEYSPEYDSNIMKYSQHDIDRFDNHTERHPSPVSSLSDWRNQLLIRGSYRSIFFLDRMTTLSATIRTNLWANSSVLNYQSSWFQMEQSLTDNVSLKVAYSLLRNFPLRNFVDRETNTWTMARYSQNEYTAKLQYNPIKGLTVEPYTQWRVMYYNKYFTTFDMAGRSYGISGNYVWNKFVETGLSYEYGIMDNVGKGPVTPLVEYDPNSEDSEYGTRSYLEDEFKFNVVGKPEIGMLGKIRVGLDYSYKFRYYTSKLPIVIDQFHSGRTYDLNTIGFEIGGDPVRNTTVTFRIEDEERVNKSPEPKVKVYRDYKATHIGMTISYRIF